MFASISRSRSGIHRPEFGQINLGAASWCRGLTGFVRPTKFGAIDLVSGQRYTTIGGTPEYANSTKGRLVDLVSGSSEYIELGTRFNNLSIPFAFAQVVQSSSVNSFSISSRSNSSAEGVEFLIGGGGTAGTFQFRFQTSGAYNIPNAIAGNSTTAPNLLLGHVRADGVAEFYVNTIQNVTIASGASTGTITGSQNMRIGSRGTTYLSGQVGDSWFFNGELRPSQIAEFLRDPYAVYRRTKRIFFPVAGGDVTVALTGASMTASAGTLVSAITYPLTGAAITASAGTLVPDIAYSISGAAITAAAGTLVSAISYALTGAQITSAAGTVGTEGGDVIVALTGASVTVSAGTLVASVQQALTGAAITSAAGTVTPGISYALTGSQFSAAAGTVASAIEAALTGSQITASAGVVVPDLTKALTGASVTVSAGSLVAAITQALSGTQIVASAGTVTVEGAAMTIPGLEFTLPTMRMHFDLPTNRMHFDVDE